MNTLFLAVRAETLKLKRTLAFGLVFLAPFVILLMQLAMYSDHAEFYLGEEGINPWNTFNQTMLVYWSFMMLPLFITLESALLGSLEHARHNWKMLYVQPVPRWAFYAAKQLINMALIGLSMIVLIALMYLGGLIIYALFPQYDFAQPFPWLWTLKLSGLAFLSSWAIISIHVWISTRWPSFVVACASGIAATVAAIFVFGSDYAGYYPWTIPGVIATEALKPAELSLSLAISLGIALLITLFGGWNVIKQDTL